MSAAAIALERRRQVLLMTVSLQRFALQGDIGTLRASLQPRPWGGALAVLSLRMLSIAMRLWPASSRR